MIRRTPRWACFVEQLEVRHCLSTVALIEHAIDRNPDLVFQDIDLADVDGDGDRDVVVGYFNQVSAGVGWYERVDGPERFAELQILIQDTQPMFPVALVTADIDGDDDLDIVRGLIGQAQMVWHANTDGKATFGPPQIIAFATEREISQIKAIDIDLDGDLDLLTSSAASFLPSSAFQQVTWHENIDGKGTFGSGNVVAETSSEIALSFDVDCDGDHDVISGVDPPAGPSQIRWHENLNESGTQWLANGIVSYQAIAATQLDSDLDGDLDLVVTATNDDGENILHIVNDACSGGAFSFAIEPILRSGSTGNGFVPDGVTQVDIDGDADTDVLVVRESFAGRFRVQSIDLLQNVDGRFRAPVRIGTIHLSRATEAFSDWAAADVDLDGDLDVVLSTLDSLRWYENRIVGDSTGDGVFDSSDLIMVFQAGKYDDLVVGNATFAEGDWNGDGDFDSSDLVQAFQGGHYRFDSPLNAAEIAAAVDLAFAAENEEKTD